MNICENCGNEHDGEYGSGRFCSTKCSRGFSTKAKRKEINKKVSIKLKGPIYNCINCNKPINKSGYCKICLCKTDEYRQMMSLHTIGKNGGYRKGAGRSNGGYYAKQYFDSQFEIEVAKFLDLHNIKWKRNTKRFYFNWLGKDTYYIPVFIINENLYLETKGYWYNDKKEKTLKAIEQNNLNWVLLMQKEEWDINKNILLEKINIGARSN